MTAVGPKSRKTVIRGLFSSLNTKEKKVVFANLVRFFFSLLCNWKCALGQRLALFFFFFK